MTMFRVTRDAQTDVAGIGDYVAQYNPSAAKRVVRAIRNTFEFLGEHPDAGTACDEWLTRGRMFIARKPASNYIVFFVPGKGRIDIVAVLHGARDLPAELAARQFYPDSPIA
jgi:plasmid stabilization system protein ParE